MVFHACMIDGNLNDSKFSEPVPWVGLYVAVASFLCSIAMAADAFIGFRKGKVWFPCIYFPMNAASLTLLSIVTKLPTDLNTAMPRRQDQLSKLSSSVLLCTIIANFMPSVGIMKDSELLSNTIALAILVVTVVVNIGIQMGTGVIYAFIPEHAVIMLFMLLLLLLLCSSALTVPCTKKLLHHQYQCRYLKASGLYSDEAFKIGSFSVEKLKEDLKMHWLMAYTGYPQYVQARSATATASGALCLFGALILVEAGARSLVKGCMNFCSGDSDYKWSTSLVLFSQSIAVLAGTISPAIRWFHAINMRCQKGGQFSLRDEFKVEGYWIKGLTEWKESLLSFRISSRNCRKIVHVLRHWIIDALIAIQTAAIRVSKFVRFISTLIVSCFSWFMPSFNCTGLRRKLRSIEVTLRGPGSANADFANALMSGFVLHLEGEEEVVYSIMRKGCTTTEHLFRKGRENQPTHLIDLLKKFCVSRSFKGIAEFDGENVPNIGSEKPPNCWALPLVTLTCIAVAVRGTDRKEIKSLLRGVNEGLEYVRLIEKNLGEGRLKNSREAADIVWVCLDYHDRWLNEDLHKIVAEEKSAEAVIKKLVASGRKNALDFLARVTHKKSHEWPAKVLAANAMYRIGETVLSYKHIFEMDGTLFQWLEATIADIMAACLTNLPRAILMECYCSSIEARGKSVYKAAHVLGETQDILLKLGQNNFLNLDPNCMANIDEWRLIKQKIPS